MPNIRTLLLDFRHAHDAWAPIEQAYHEATEAHRVALHRAQEQSEILAATQNEFGSLSQQKNAAAADPCLVVALRDKYHAAFREQVRLQEEAAALQNAAVELALQVTQTRSDRERAAQALLTYITECPLSEIDSLARIIDPRPAETAQDEPEAHPS